MAREGDYWTLWSWKTGHTSFIEVRCYLQTKQKLFIIYYKRIIIYIFFCNSFPKTTYLDSEDLKKYNFPTLIDMNGFNDSSDDLVEELLRIVFFGRLSKEEKLVDAVNIYRYWVLS